MGRKWLILLVALLGTCASTDMEPKRTKMREGTDTFKAACYWTQTMGYADVDCSKFDKPTAVFSNVVRAWKGRNMLGFYFHGEKFVFVRSDISERMQQEVLFHETVHYVLYETYGNNVGRCESEAAARMATDLYMRRAYDMRWKKWYKC